MSSREKNLIVVGIALVLGGLFWFLMFRPIQSDISIKEAEINTLNTELNELTTEYVKKDSYLSDIEEKTEYIEFVNSRFPADVTQEMIIHTVLGIEDEIESLAIEEYKMNTQEILLTDGEFKDPETEEIKYEEILIKQINEFSIEMNYEDAKKMMAFIKDNEYKLSIENMRMSNDLKTDLVSLEFNLNFFALRSVDRIFVPEDYFGPFEMKEDSIFRPFDHFPEEFSTQNSNSEDEDELSSEKDDIMVNLGSIYSDRSSIIVYENKDGNGDASGDSYLYGDTDKSESLEIVFDQDGDTYTYKYKLPSGRYPSGYGTGIAFDAGDYIGIGVASTPRVDETDLSGVDVSIINNTDLPVVVNILADDEETPRFNVVSQTGDVTVKN